LIGILKQDMIATLSGEITGKKTDQVVLECGGVGYGLYVTFEDFGALETGSKTKLYVYEHIRENSHDLFGFKSLETKALFELLLTVNGVGPKMALSILSISLSFFLSLFPLS
jgi:Holliday junction DNA helicase RuvA